MYPGRWEWDLSDRNIQTF